MKRLVATLLALPALYLLCAIAGALVSGGTETTKTPSKHIYLVQGPIHTDFVIPLDQHSRAAMEAIGYDLSQTPEAQTLIIGWGGAAFYTTIGTYRDVSARAIWNSVMGDASVLRIDVTGPVPANVELPLIPLDDDQYAKLLAGIVDSVTGAPHVLKGGFTSTDAFYPAKGRFNILNTCNTWIGETLRRAGVRFGVWTPLTLSVNISRKFYHSN